MGITRVLTGVWRRLSEAVSCVESDFWHCVQVMPSSERLLSSITMKGPMRWRSRLDIGIVAWWKRDRLG